MLAAPQLAAHAVARGSRVGMDLLAGRKTLEGRIRDGGVRFDRARRREGLGRALSAAARGGARALCADRPRRGSPAPAVATGAPRPTRRALGGAACRSD